MSQITGAPPMKYHDQGRSNIVHAAVRPASICQSCWDNVFSAQLGLLAKPILRTGTDEPPRGGHSYKSTADELRSQAAGGCKWCQFIIRVKNESCPSAESPFDIIVGVRPQTSYLGSLKATQVLCIFINGLAGFEGYLYADADDPAAEHIIGRSRIVDVGSSRALALAKQHLEDCIHSHTNCTPPVTPTPLLPSRVIDCSDPNCPQLTVTRGLRGSYTALSYVWGEPQPHSTTQANITAYITKGIDPTHLPQTILDAMYLTRVLELRYLWVDSLCIIQDSGEDKRSEIARMGHIYREAYVTIIAACAPRVSAGFLGARPPVPPVEFPRDIAMPFMCLPSLANGVPECVGTVHISPTSLYNALGDSYDHWWDYFPETEPVNDRAWCMQEYAMSPRALVFASHTVQFHCRTGGAQNVGGSHNDHPDRDEFLPESFFKFFAEDTQTSPAPPAFPKVVLGSLAWQGVHDAWYHAVKTYTRRWSTKPEDRLLAFSGVAEAFGHVLSAKYLAGLWADTLLSDLLWSKYVDKDMERPKEYRAPSWSWAAVDGYVLPGTFLGSDEGKWTRQVFVADVVRCEVELKSAEYPFGEVKGGRLVLRGHLVQCMWDAEVSDRVYRIREPSGLEEGSDHLQFRSVQALEETSSQRECHIGFGEIDSKDDEKVHNVWVVPVLRANEKTILGIIVALVPNEGDLDVVEYGRVGRFSSGGMEISASWLEAEQVVNITIV